MHCHLLKMFSDTTQLVEPTLGPSYPWSIYFYNPTKKKTVMDDIYYYKEMISFLQMAMIFFHLYHYFQIEVAELKIALPISLEYAIYTDFFLPK